MTWQFKQELARKFVHLLSLLVILIYFLASDYFNKNIAMLILVLILILFLTAEYLRLEVKRKIPVLNKIWKYVRRKKEASSMGADVFFITGAIIVLAVFDAKVAISAILMTTFGDLSAALIGKRFGKHYLTILEDRAWEGILAEFIVDIIIGIIVFYPLLALPQIWLVIFAMAAVATFVETIIYQMEDNIIIPIFAGFTGQVILFLSSTI